MGAIRGRPEEERTLGQVLGRRLVGRPCGPAAADGAPHRGAGRPGAAAGATVNTGIGLGVKVNRGMRARSAGGRLAAGKGRGGEQASLQCAGLLAGLAVRG
eukprot:XP_001696564.1 predicted protein [Chlamydomonas reinhardtii]